MIQNLQISSLDWTTISVLHCIVKKGSRLIRVFQYKLLNNVLYLSEMFRKFDSFICSFCKMIDETPLHLFYNCTKSKLHWDQLKELMSNITLFIPSLMPQNAILGHIDPSGDYVSVSHLIPIYVLHITLHIYLHITYLHKF